MNEKIVKLIVIVPAYNEAKKISKTIQSLSLIKTTLAGANIKCLLYLVNDGSEDETGQLAQDAGADRVIHHKINQGLGAAVRTGLKAAFADGADIAVKFDGDLQHDPNDIIKLIQPILDDSADVVYGNRFELISYRMPIVRKLGNTVFTGLMRWLTKWPLKDSQPGILSVNKNYLSVCNIPGNYNYTQQILLDAYHKGMRFTHVPVSFSERTTGKSFVSYKYPFRVIPQIIMVLVSVKPMKVFGPIGFLMLGIGSAVFLVEITLWLMGITSKPTMHDNAIIGFSLFGLQTLFFGILAELIIQTRER